MSNGKVKLEKMDYGYINKRKRQLLMQSFLIFFCGAAVFLLGLALNKFQTANIFTIISVLFALPLARYVTVFVVVFPYKTPAKEKFDKVAEKVNVSGLVLSDLVFTSSETPMHLDFAVLSGSHAYLYSEEPKSEKEKTRLSKVESYLNEHFKNEKFDVKAKLYTDFSAFLNVCGGSKVNEEEMEILNKEKESMEYFIV